MRRFLRWWTTAMVAVAPSLIKAMYNLEWSDLKLWAMFVFTFSFGICAYAEGMLDEKAEKS